MTRSLQQVTWAPSEATADGLAAVEGWRALCPDLAERVLPPVLIDAARPPWPGPPVDAVFAANLTHIAPWSATLSLVAGAAARLVEGGLLLIYGPFNEGGGFTGPATPPLTPICAGETPHGGCATVRRWTRRPRRRTSPPGRTA